MTAKENVQNMILDILVYATPFKISDDKWGYKWIGFCYGKRFIVIENPHINEISFNKEKGEYFFCDKSQQDLLPLEIRRLTYSTPLSNEFFSLRVGKDKSVEIIMKLIEKGYDMEKDIVCYKHGKFPYQVCEKLTNSVLVEMMEDTTIVWKENISREKETMDNNLYLVLYKNLVELYKDNKEIRIEISNKTKNGFYCMCSTKVLDVELSEEHIWVHLDSGEMMISQDDRISLFKRKDRVLDKVFQIESEEYRITLDTSECED